MSVLSILIRFHKFNSISVTTFILLSLFVPIFLKQRKCNPSFQTCKPPQLLQSPINSFFVYPLNTLFFISYSKIWHISGIPKGYQWRSRIILKWLLLFKHCYGNHIRRTWGGRWLQSLELVQSSPAKIQTLDLLYSRLYTPFSLCVDIDIVLIFCHIIKLVRCVLLLFSWEWVCCFSLRILSYIPFSLVSNPWRLAICFCCGRRASRGLCLWKSSFDALVVRIIRMLCFIVSSRSFLLFTFLYHRFRHIVAFLPLIHS